MGVSGPALAYGDLSLGACGGASRGCTYFAIFRDPVDRVVSAFIYCQARPDAICDAASATLEGPSLADWTRAWGNDAVEQLAVVPARAFCAAPARDRARPAFVARDVQRWVNARFGRPTRDDLALVRARVLPRLAVVGLTHRLAETCRLLEAAFGWRFPRPPPMINAAPADARKAALASEVRAGLLHDVALDAALYRNAEAIFERQFAVLTKSAAAKGTAE
ncbi:hypothetical protein M885DRAFT_576229 [Pelagophyceae sp. CCMP2097]|nr:hypothetical protein M885DRAFT_576229 [Pelagophyceae sp. CCMP2097]